MMEQVRVQTEGKAAVPAVAAVAKKTAKATDEYFPGEHDLDKELFAKADEVQKEVANMKDPTVEDAPKKAAALNAQSQESQQQRAARYFAAHGMKKVGHMLGEELSEKA